MGWARRFAAAGFRSLRSAIWPTSGSVTRRTLVALALLFAGCVAEDFFWTGPRTDAYDFEGLPAERLEERELEAPTGERVAALWIAPPDPAAPVVLFLHGAGTNLERSVPRLEALVALEVGVFAIDYRGFGRSEALLRSRNERRPCRHLMDPLLHVQSCHADDRLRALNNKW